MVRSKDRGSWRMRKGVFRGGGGGLGVFSPVGEEEVESSGGDV